MSFVLTYGILFLILGISGMFNEAQICANLHWQSQEVYAVSITLAVVGSWMAFFTVDYLCDKVKKLEREGEKQERN